jgi:hypothetical protein
MYWEEQDLMSLLFCHNLNHRLLIFPFDAFVQY